MVAEVAEFITARAAVLEELAFLERQGHQPPRSLMLGAMIEVPSLLFQLDAFLTEVDFASIGSNDLMQFLFAADRGHPKLAGRYDPLSPSGLRALRCVVERASAFNVPVTLCGEMAGRPLDAMTLIGLGYRSISMSPAAIGPVKSMTLMLDAGKLEGFLLPLLRRGDHSIRSELMGYAAENNIPV